MGTASGVEDKSTKSTCSQRVIRIERYHAVTDPTREGTDGEDLESNVAPLEEGLRISPFEGVHQPIPILLHHVYLALQGLHVLPICVISQYQFLLGQMGLPCLGKSGTVFGVVPCHFEEGEVHYFLLETDDDKDLTVLLLWVVQGHVVPHIVDDVAELQLLDDFQLVGIRTLSVPSHGVFAQLLDIH